MNTIDKSAVAFRKLHAGAHLVLKVGGGEIASPAFATLIADIRSLTADGIRIVLVFGGGRQIDTHWGKLHLEPRPKHDGVGVTTAEVLRDGVLPAYEEIRQQLTHSFPAIAIVASEDIECDLDAEYGLVGKVRRVNLPLDASLAGVGFVGRTPDTLVNVNADQVVAAIVQGYQFRIDEVMLLTPTGGVLNRSGEVVSLLTRRSIADVLGGTHLDIACDGGMRKKLLEVQDILDCIDRAVITGITDVRQEIERWQGKGTMCVDEDERDFTALQQHEETIFDAVVDDHVRRGIFRPRTPGEIRELARYHRLLRVGGSPLGGFSLLQREGGWSELAAFWAGYLRNGISTMLTEELKKTMKKENLAKAYALTTQEEMRALLESSGFQNYGKIRDLQRDPHTDLPAIVTTYDASERDPWILTMHAREQAA